MKKPEKDSKPRKTAQASGQAATTAEQEVSTAGAGSQGPAIDAPREVELDAEAANTNVAASGTVVAELGCSPQRTVQVPVFELLTLSFPLPTGIPEEALKAASILVKAKAANGRWRVGRQFTREETVIPYPDLDAAEIVALTRDPELVVSVRVPRPG
jgi:hypothetical protein